MFGISVFLTGLKQSPSPYKKVSKPIGSLDKSTHSQQEFSNLFNSMPSTKRNLLVTLFYLLHPNLLGECKIKKEAKVMNMSQLTRLINIWETDNILQVNKEQVVFSPQAASYLAKEKLPI